MRHRTIVSALALLLLASCSGATSSLGPAGPTPDPNFTWRSFLAGYSRDLLADPGIRVRVPPDAQQSEWLGFEGATEQQIAVLEAKLGKHLPPSYRAFLLASNGWRQTSPFIDRLYGAGEVDWFRVRNRDWIDSWNFGTKLLPGPSVSDAKYFVYGRAQDPAYGRWEYLEDALEISPEGDAAIYLLNPRVVFPDGEWEAWFFASWLPGANRYRSFREMMSAERAQLALYKQKP